MTDPVLVPRARRELWHWHQHPAFAADDRTLGERAADRMRNVMGSWAFIFGFLATMLTWAAVNSLFLQRVVHHKPFDPYPYILLNLMLSTLAGLQGGILLIAAKRADQIAAKVAMHTLAEAIKSDVKLDAILEHLGIAVPQAALAVDPDDPEGSGPPPGRGLDPA